MMFIDKVSAALTDDTRKVFREYNYTKLTDSGKKVECILPFNSNYQIYLKNDNTCRVKVEIDIDGSVISSSGLIVAANSSMYLERFVENNAKFLFVRKNHPQVALPSSEENGLLTIKVSKEKEVSFTETWMELMKKTWHPPYDYYQYPLYYPYQPHQPYYPGTHWTTGTPSTVYCSALADNTLNDGHSVNYCHTSFPGESDKVVSISSITTASYCGDPPPAYPGANGPFGANQLWQITPEQKPEVGATIEGSKSDQSFTNTTWNGSVGESLIFQFKMLGKDAKLSEKEEADLQEYKRLKAKFEGK